MPELNPVAVKWVAALRSGKYKQGRNYLRSKDNKFCCLGVLCELAVEDKVIDPPRLVPAYTEDKDGNEISRCTYVYSYGKYPDSKRTYLPEAVREWADLIDPAGSHTTDKGRRYLDFLNDHEHWSFDQIADLIESNPKDLFVDIKKL